MAPVESLKKKITSRTAKVGIIGMGYVGRDLALATTAAGFETVGFVTKESRAEQINNQGTKLLSGTTDKSKLKDCDIILLCVQTPIHEDKRPDLSYLIKASEEVAVTLRPGQLVVIESSIFPGTTRQYVLPILKKTKLKHDKDYFLSFSPERVDPGNKVYQVPDIPKVVSGIGKNSLVLSELFYQAIIKKVVPVSSIETAELVKILENTFRLVNISLLNEMVGYAKALDIDIWEVVDAASTKPFGFLPHYPGPGIGGHCIPVDPYYLIDDAKKRGIPLAMVEHAGKINDDQPAKVVERAINILQMTNGTKKEHKALIVGVAYKPDIDDVRESPALKVIELLEKRGIEVSYYDPYVPKLNGFTSMELTKPNVADHDIVIIITHHSNIEYVKLAEFERPILDTRHVYARPTDNIYYL